VLRERRGQNAISNEQRRRPLSHGGDRSLRIDAH
jgi:hypothetical protein